MSFDISPYKLPDDAFWAGTDRARDPLVRQLLGRFQGLLIDGPLRVELGRRDRLPVGLYHFGPIREMAYVSLPRHGVITAIDLATNRLYLAAGSALERDEDLEDPDPVDPARLPEGDMCTTHSADLRELLGLPWVAARYWVTTLLRGSASNRLVVDMVDDSDTGAVERPRAAGGDVLPLQAADDQSAEALSLPDEMGLVLAVARVHSASDGGAWPLRAAFRMPSTVIPLNIHLVIIGADDGQVVQLCVSPTSWSMQTGGFVGRFSLDLTAHLAFSEPQTYFFRAFAQSLMSEPVAGAWLPD